jgi:CubicO group peptidase (beta-lactamase class C family)
VLKQETVKLMARNAIGDLDVPMVRSNNPALALEVETFPGQVKKWGLTFLINTKDVEGFRAAGSLTWGGIHNTYFWIDLKQRITAVAMMQILPIGDPHVLRTMIAFEQALLCGEIARIIWGRAGNGSRKFETVVPLGSRRRRYALDFQITPKRSLNGFVADDIAGNQ